MHKKEIQVLYIAKNIPVPQRRSNRIILDIGHNLSSFCNIRFLFPKEIVPFWLKNNPRFAYLYNLKNWISEGYKIEAIPYIKLPFKHFQYWSLFFLPQKIRKYVKENAKPDLVHAHYLFPDGYMAYEIYKKFNIPYILTIRNQDKQYLELISNNNLDFRKARKILKEARQVLVPNGGYKEYVLNRFGLETSIIPHGIESKAFSHLKKKVKDKVTITCVADTLPTKNVDWVIKVVKKYNGSKNVELIVIGDVCTKETIKDLKGNDSRIKLLGKIPRKEVLNHLEESDIFALPSSKETFGLVYLEAAANHNAIIGYKGEGVWGVFENEKEMLFARNYEDFKQTLFSLINNTKKITELSKNAYKKAQTLTWDEVKKRYFEVYQEALNSSS